MAIFDAYIRSTLNFFNSSDFSILHRGCIYAMTRDQMKLLPIQQYQKAEIRLLLACLTNRLDDELIETANSFDSQGGNFFDFFEDAYPRYGTECDSLEFLDGYCGFEKDLQYLKNFLLWILKRDSIDPVLPTWNWLNDNHAQDILRRKEIENDEEIQGEIRRLGLEVNKRLA
jgi:hypothetical protein